MRVSLTARYVSHPTIDFGARRAGWRRRRLGLATGAVTFHRPRGGDARRATVSLLRPLTSGFSFPSAGRPGLVGDHRVVHPHGSPRVRRA